MAYGAWVRPHLGGSRMVVTSEIESLRFVNVTEKSHGPKVFQLASFHKMSSDLASTSVDKRRAGGERIDFSLLLVPRQRLRHTIPRSGQTLTISETKRKGTTIWVCCR